MLWVVVIVLLGSLALGLAVGRWWALAVPATAWLAVLVLTQIDWWYERVSEDWQAVLFEVFAVGIVATAAGVAVRRRDELIPTLRR